MKSLSLNINRMYESKRQCYLIWVSCFWWIKWCTIENIYGNYLNSMYVKKRQCSYYLGIIFLIKIMISVSQCVAITTLKLLRFYITATPYILMSLPCMTSSSFTLILFIGWFRHKYRKFSCTIVWSWLIFQKCIVFYFISILIPMFWFKFWNLIYISNTFYEKETVVHWPPFT